MEQLKQNKTIYSFKVVSIAPFNLNCSMLALQIVSLLDKKKKFEQKKKELNLKLKVVENWQNKNQAICILFDFLYCSSFVLIKKNCVFFSYLIDPEYKMKSGTATPSSTLQNSINCNDHELLNRTTMGEETRKGYITGVSITELYTS